MQQQLRVGAIALAVLVSTTVAGAQTSTSPPTSGSPSQLTLSSSQQELLGQRLRSEQAQRAPEGYQPQVGSKVPDSMARQSLPPEVIMQIPQLQTYHYSMMPGHILVIDPKNDVVMEIIPLPATTGTSPSR
jgi:hypothetical protein